ncbi:hypothetical protein [Chitinolyticbacter albus]|uniref:hypothetical protein n=1 Tax=Chitinolyticbacter albus TaxID=2961951 RepID=UPI00210CE961|nr:hypothetical protein [Chitinolyticbacter albus]
MISRTERRVGALCAVTGSALLLLGTYLHPMHADPNAPAAAFAEYATDHGWIASHLTQFVGVGLLVAALILLARLLELKGRAGWARIAAGGAIASLAMAGALQAVDGIALKSMVDAWAVAPALQKEVVFYAAFAVRQVEIGLASLSSLLFGLTAMVYGGALIVDRGYWRWMGGLAIVGGLSTALAGLLIAYTGFSGLAMTLNMLGISILLLWMLALAVCMWRDETPLAP